VAGVRDASGAAVALAACLLGHGAERWLFFAEARHTVRLYHGDATT
jgi:DMSO reductase anchor subunit